MTQEPQLRMSGARVTIIGYEFNKVSLTWRTLHINGALVETLELH